MSPAAPAEEDFFLHVFEIGSKGKTGKKRAALVEGVNFQVAAFERGPVVLFSTRDTPVSTGEVSLPDLGCDSLIVTSLHPESMYELNFGGLNVSPSPGAVLPGVSAGTMRARSNT